MYQGQTNKFLGAIPAMVAMGMLATCKVASAGANLVFNYPNGFAGTTGVIKIDGAAQLLSPQIALTSLFVHNVGAAWYMAQQNITSFTTDFTFNMGTTAAGAPSGITFCIQNTNAKQNPLAWGTGLTSDANLAGYGIYTPGGSQYPVLNSIAIKFDTSGGNGQNNFPSGGHPNSTGLYVNGGPYGAFIPLNDLNPSGINFYNGDNVAAHIVYDGNILTMTLRDTATNAQSRMSWPIDIPSITGSNTAWIGFTGGTVVPTAPTVLNWDYSTGFNTRLTTPTFSLSAGTYPSTQTVTLSAPSGATIYYTTNGQQPTTSSSKYSGPITVVSSEIVQAVAVQTGYTDSFVGTANYVIGAAGTPIINLPNGFANALGFITMVGSTKLSGSSIQLTDTNPLGLEAGAAWYDVPVNVQSFTSNFTVQFLNAAANGMTFTIQNQPKASTDSTLLYVSGGANALANNQSGLGSSALVAGPAGQNGGLSNSVSVILDLYNGSGNSTGLYTNGTLPTGSSIDMSTAGINLHSGTPFNVALAYNGSVLNMTVTDSKSKASFSKSWTIDIPTIVGGNTAYVGFTGATGGQTANQYVQAWTYAASASAAAAAVPAAPTNLKVQ